jgi:hypothetical protein
MSWQHKEMVFAPLTSYMIGNSFSVSLKKKGTIMSPLFFSANPDLFAEVSNRSHVRQSNN